MQLRTPKHTRSIILSVSTCIRFLARCLVEGFTMAASIIMGDAMADVKLRARLKRPCIALCDTACQAEQPRNPLVEKCHLVSRRIARNTDYKCLPGHKQSCERRFHRPRNHLPNSGSTAILASWTDHLHAR